MEKERGIKITNIDKKKQCDIHVVSKFYKCWNCKNFLIEQIESKKNYAKYFCKKHKENCNITDPKWQTCDDFEVNCNFC